MKKKLIYLLLSLVIVILAVSPVLAASSATITVVNTGSAYTMLPISVPMSNSSLASGNFITASGLDVLLSGTIPCMLTGTQTLFAAPIGVGVNPFYYTTGNTPLTSMPIIAGYGGYITTTDNAALEPGTQFSIVTNGYVNTTAGSGNIISKAGALTIYTDSATTGKIDVAVGGTTLSQTGTGNFWTLYSGNTQTGVGERFTAFTASQTITSIQFSLDKTGSPTGLATVNVRNGATGALIGTLGTIGVATLTNSYAYYTITGSVANGAVTNLIIDIEYSGGDGSNYIAAQSSNANPYAGGVLTSYGVSWADTASNDLTWQNLLYMPLPLVSITGVSSGAGTLSLSEVTAASGTLTLSWTPTGGSANTATVTGAGSVPDTANNWIITPSPYMNYITITTAVTSYTEKLKYQPATIIIGTALPNLDSGGAYPGVFTFGTNPTGITTTLGALLATASSASSSSALGTPNLIPDVALNAKITGGNSGTTFPLYALFSSLLNDYNSMRPGSTPIPMAYFWRLVAAIIAFLFGTGVLIATRSMLFGAIAYGLGLLVPTLWLGGVFDWWVPVFYIIGAVVITMLSTKWTSSSIV